MIFNLLDDAKLQGNLSASHMLLPITISKLALKSSPPPLALVGQGVLLSQEDKRYVQLRKESTRGGA